MPLAIRRLLSQAPLLFILAVFLAAPLLLVNPYHLQVLIFIGIYVILVLSLNLLNGFAGLLSIGHAAFYGIGAYASAKLVMDLNLPFLAAMPSAALIAGLGGYLIAKPTLRLSGIYMTLATLGFNIIFFLILQNWMSFTNGPLGIMDIPAPQILGWQVDSRVEYYYLILALVVPFGLVQARQDTVTVEFWHTYNQTSPENEMLVNTLIPMFEETHPNITVKSVPFPYGEFRQTLLTSLAGGEGPDLARLDIIWSPEYREPLKSVRMRFAMPLVNLLMLLSRRS